MTVGQPRDLSPIRRDTSNQKCMASKTSTTEDFPKPHQSTSGVIKRGKERVRQFLQECTLGDFLSHRPPRQVVSFDVDTTISDALLQLQKCNILSAPLFDTNSNAYYGFVDRWDILRQVLKSIDLQRVRHDELPYQLKKLGDILQTETLSVFSSLEDGELIYKANESHSLYQVVRYGFSRTHGGRFEDVCHRVAVFDFDDGHCTPSSETMLENERQRWTEPSESCSELNVETTRPMRVQNIVSQSDILRLIERHKDEFVEILSVPISDLHLAEKQVVCVPVDMLAVHAFAAMCAFHVTSVGVVDNRRGGVLAANFSASDLRGIHTKHFPALALPVMKFLQKRESLRSMESLEGDTFLGDWGLSGEENNSFPIVDAISPENTLKEAIEHLVQHSHHRVYVVDDNDRPLGIITITDILRLFL